MGPKKESKIPFWFDFLAKKSLYFSIELTRKKINGFGNFFLIDPKNQKNSNFRAKDRGNKLFLSN